MTDFELVKDLLKKDRSFRRFDESRKINQSDLSELVELTRYCASGRNLQPLRYHIVTDSAMCDKLFHTLGWAGYLTDWDGPEPGERPVAYLIQCLDTDLTKNCLCDDGLQLQAITIGATAKGLGACIVKSFNASKVREIFDIKENLEIMYILALGYPIEKIEIEDINDSSDIKYYRTSDKVHHVPKRKLDELLF